jgi:hypothetical protein
MYRKRGAVNEGYIPGTAHTTIGAHGTCRSGPAPSTSEVEKKED